MGKLLCIKDVANVIPLCYTGGAFAFYLQLADADKISTEKVKGALLATFAVDPYFGYEKFVGRMLHTGESPDVYLAELRCLVSLFSGMTDRAFACAFVAGLLENLRQLLMAG